MSTNRNKTNYEFTGETIIYNQRILSQIRATKDMGDIKKGDIGGYIENTSNLQGNAWVYPEGKIYGNARVYGNAKIYGFSEIYGNVKIYDKSRVRDYASVSGNVVLKGNSEIGMYANIEGRFVIDNNAYINSQKDFCVFQNMIGNRDSIIAFRTKNRNVQINSSLFSDNLRNFESYVDSMSNDDPSRSTLYSIIVIIKQKFNI